MSEGGNALIWQRSGRFAALLAGAAIVVAACGTTASSSAPSAASAEPSAPASSEASPSGSAAAGGATSVTFIPKQINNPYFDAAKEGADKAADGAWGQRHPGRSQRRHRGAGLVHPGRYYAGRERDRDLRQ